MAAGITLNNNLFETVLRDLLVERAEFTVQIYEGSGTQWRKVKCVPNFSSKSQVLKCCGTACLLWAKR